MIEVRPLGRVESPLKDRSDAPRQPDEGAPSARLAFDPAWLEGLADIRPGDRMVLLTWLDRARRDILRVHPRGDPDRDETGVFSTRSPDRPNPIGLHEVTVTAVHGAVITVDHLEAIDGTPILDLKPVLGERRGR